jgi:hypothetical protein
MLRYHSLAVEPPFKRMHARSNRARSTDPRQPDGSSDRLLPGGLRVRVALGGRLALVAQRIEQRGPNAPVAGSNPAEGSTGHSHNRTCNGLLSRVDQGSSPW